MLGKKQNNIVKISLIIIAIVIMIILIYTWVNESKYDYSFSRLMVMFNGETQNNIIAVTQFNRTEGESGISNDIFKEYFSEELNNLSRNMNHDISIEIEYCLFKRDACAIKIEYGPILLTDRKNELLLDIKSELESKWYVKNVELDLRLESL